MLYIHIPYCAAKCLYCDFYSGGNPDWEALRCCLCNELELRLASESHGLPASMGSIYFGGGTPSMMPPDIFAVLIDDILTTLARHGIEIDKNVEFTIEVNPEDVDMNHIMRWKESGVNRVSMGVQSLSDDELQLLRRRHSSDKAVEASWLLRENFSNISFDIIYGIPHKTPTHAMKDESSFSRHSALKRLEKTMAGLLSINPDHISAYSMMYEEGTALTHLRDIGKINPADDDTVIAMYTLVSTMLESAGLEQYEISNYARPGYRSRHNSGYWSGKPYLGIGHSACSFDGACTRRSNYSDLKGYIANFTSPHPAIFYHKETLSKEERREEVIFTQLRRKEGIDLDYFTRKFGNQSTSRLIADAENALSASDLILTDTSLSLSRQAIMKSDSIILNLI